MSDNVEMDVLHFLHFGKDGIKQMGYSPDSFIQIGIQVSILTIIFQTSKRIYN